MTAAQPAPGPGERGGRPEPDGRHMDILRLATAGSVDDGKSTLIGRLLFDSKSIFEDQLAAVERTSKERGEGLRVILKNVYRVGVEEHRRVRVAEYALDERPRLLGFAQSRTDDDGVRPIANLGLDLCLARRPFGIEGRRHRRQNCRHIIGRDQRSYQSDPAS